MIFKCVDRSAFSYNRPAFFPNGHFLCLYYFTLSSTAMFRLFTAIPSHSFAGQFQIPYVLTASMRWSTGRHLKNGPVITVPLINTCTLVRKSLIPQQKRVVKVSSPSQTKHRQ